MTDLPVRAAEGGPLSLEEMAALIALEEEKACQQLYQAAYAVKSRYVGRQVYLRGLIEYANICARNCLYCGIRRDNRKIRRFTLSLEEILQAAGLAHLYGYGSVVLQGGERSDAGAVDFIEEAVGRIHGQYPDLGITLSCGEQDISVYRRWKAAGAARYLLRIETSSRELFYRIHPAENDFDARLQALKDLRTAGYQVGSGVMIGLPGQTALDLARDVMFFRDMDLDMIGMGPWIPQHDAPLADETPETPEKAARRFQLGLNMIAVVRLVLKDVNIAAATALQALRPADGRELGLLAGANVIMPNVGDVVHREDYQLYDGKPDLDENAENIRQALNDSVARIGESIATFVPGTPRHYLERTENRPSLSEL
ncbi:MAG: [Lentisphaeria bacterium]|nr:[FeFe] hydrogenase H-cluster radical SAM maturase HydE [Lentisphaeria bacterium]